MKKILNSVLLLVVLGVLLTGCDLNQVVSVNTPVPGSSSSSGSNPPVPTAAVGQPVGGGGIQIPGVQLNIFAPGPNPELNKPGAGGHVAGILLGLWHGIISPVTLLISFLNSNVQMYEVHNDGGPYNLGFLLGLIVLFIIFSVLRR